jgi:hypothetical protein
MLGGMATDLDPIAPKEPARLEEALEGVEGWLDLDEAAALYEAVASHPSLTALTVVEIGSWKGRSTIAMSLGLEHRAGSGTVFAIDPHTGSREHREQLGEVDTFAEFEQNLERAGVRDRVEPIRAFSHEAAARFEPKSIDVLFVDGSHEYTDVKRDIADWMPLLADRATVAFNDPWWPSVFRALQEGVIRGSSSFRKPRFVQNTLVFERHAGERTTLRDRVGGALFRLEYAARLAHLRYLRR